MGGRSIVEEGNVGVKEVDGLLFCFRQTEIFFDRIKHRYMCTINPLDTSATVHIFLDF